MSRESVECRLPTTFFLCGSGLFEGVLFASDRQDDRLNLLHILILFRFGTWWIGKLLTVGMTCVLHHRDLEILIDENEA